MNRYEHLFQFSARSIAAAASAEAQYHRMREKHWRSEFDDAVAIVEKTVGARVEKQQITGGYAVEVVIDRGDPAAYARMQRSYSKAETHARAAEGYESDANVYGSQLETIMFELSRDDVQYFRLGQEPRPDDD